MKKKCMHKHMAMVPLIVGIILIAVRLYTTWDIWIVVGAIMILKAIMMLLHKK